MSEENHAKRQAELQMASISAMVRAAELDWDRMGKLRDELEDGWDGEGGSAKATGLLAWIKAAAENDQHTLQEAAAEYLEMAEAAEDYGDREAAEDAIQSDPLSVLVRGGWHEIGEAAEDEEFEILLCTGGPACRIRGELGEYNEPSRAWMEYQDWGTPWTQHFLSHEEYGVLLSYCRRFYFGD